MRVIAGPGEGLRLRMGTPTGLSPAAADHPPAEIGTHQNAADGRVWPDKAEAAPGQGQGGPHMPEIGVLRLVRHSIGR